MNVAIVVALITGGCGLFGSFISAVIVARTSSDKLLHQLELNSAVQDEKIASYQRVTNEKIDELRKQTGEQAEWGTRIALLEDWKNRMERDEK